MTIRNVAEAKAELSRLLVLAEQGEEIVIARAGKPIVRLELIETKPVQRKLGTLKNELKWTDEMDKAFVDADADILEMFEESLGIRSAVEIPS